MRPKVLHIVRPSAGGIVSSLCTLLLNVNTDVDVAIMSTSATLSRIKTRWNGEAHILPANAFSPRMAIITSLAIFQTAKAIKADVLHGHGISVLPALVLAAWIRGCPAVLTLHNVLCTSLLQRCVLRILSRNLHVICVSDAILGSCRWLNPLSIRRIYNGVTVPENRMSKDEARQLLGLKSDRQLVISVSRLAPEKGLSTLAKAASQIDACVTIVGDGPERQHLSTYPNIRLVGHVDDPSAWYCAADIVAVPSLSEGLGLSAIEALSMGCPVVASDVGGLKEVITEPQLGSLVPIANVTALTRALNVWISTSRSTESAEKVRREYVLKHFSITQMVEETLKLYVSIVTA